MTTICSNENYTLKLGEYENELLYLLVHTEYGVTEGAFSSLPEALTAFEVSTRLIEQEVWKEVAESKVPKKDKATLKAVH